MARLAARQHGLVTTGQLRALGLRPADIGYRARIGRLHRVHRGVFAVGHPLLTPAGRIAAAVLAVGDGAVASHLASAFLWQMTPEQPVLADVTVARRVRPRNGLRVHPVRRLSASERSRRHGIAVTAPARTLLDLAATLERDRDLLRIVREAEVQRRVSVPALRAYLRAAGRRAGVPRLDALVARGPTPTRSELEDRLVALLDGLGLPPVRFNARVCGVEVDAHVPALGLVVEGDGMRFHDTALARRADRRRQARLEAAGQRVLRIGWDDLVERPAETAERVRQAAAPAALAAVSASSS